jgi:S-disulfanyl-L-cysteine oxidoreductase SoxD
VKRQAWMALTFALAILAAGVSAAHAQMPTYNLGRPPARDELGGTELAVSPKGTELPPGSGTARQGAGIYVAKCQMCHGQDGRGGPYNRLVGGGNIPDFPFAPALWDFINRAMPRRLPDIGLRGPALTTAEVYSLTAYLLFKNNIVKEDDVLDQRTLPRVKMPNLSEQLERVIAPPR